MSSIENWLYLLLYSIAIGMLVSVAMLVVPRISKAKIGTKEAAALAGATIAILAFGAPRTDPLIAIAMGLLIVGGYAAVKIIRQRLAPPS